MLPRRLEFFNSPESTCLSSFPTTPCDSWDESQSSSTSVVDGDYNSSAAAAVARWQNNNADKQALKLSTSRAKRRLLTSPAQRLAKKAKVGHHLCTDCANCANCVVLEITKRCITWLDFQLLITFN
jgi:hypothetical protein